jgi:hypothetical protein
LPTLALGHEPLPILKADPIGPLGAHVDGCCHQEVVLCLLLLIS